MLNTFIADGPVAGRARHQLVSVAIHVGIVPLLLFGFNSTAVRQTLQHRIQLIDPVPLKPFVASRHSGGGGGQQQTLHLTKGQLPKAAVKQFVPPQLTDHVPVLAMAASIMAPPDAPLPASDLNNRGDPLAKLMNGSGGTGKGPGLGDGAGNSVGHGVGSSYGSGADSGVYGVGGSVSAPSVLVKVEPEYSEEARKAKYSGMVVLAVIVDADGFARDVRVVKSLGMGLDDKAVEAVRRWKFRAGRKDGKPVSVRAQIEVDFRLL